MANPPSPAPYLQLMHTNRKHENRPASVTQLRDMFGLRDSLKSGWIEKLPFAGDDATAGSETELQTAVIGPRKNVDLPLSIEQSNFSKT